MWDFEIEQASLNVRWSYERLIPALPVTGTEAFAVLCDGLAPFGLSASRILLEAPSSRLGDAVLTIILLEGRLGVKFWISGFEIIVDELYQDDEQNLIDIANVVFSAVSKIDANAKRGKTHLRMMYHLALDAGISEELMSKHLPLAREDNSLTPDMAVYQVKVESGTLLQDARLAVAKSALFEKAVFVDVRLDYTAFDDIGDFRHLVEANIAKLLLTLDLRERVGS